MGKEVLCFDIGGTFIKYGVIDSEGTILFQHKARTSKNDCRVTIPEQLLSIYDELKMAYAIEAISVSTAGIVNHEDGSIVYATDNLLNYSGTKLGRILEENTALPVKVINDADSAALGELWLGAGKESKHFICITVGTGIGGAVILDGKLLGGVANRSNMIGHTVISHNGRSCNCGLRGCFETYCSMNGLLNSYRELSGQEDIESAREVIDKVKTGEPAALEVFAKYLDYFSTGLVNLTHILNIGHFIIGGAFAEDKELFMKPLNDLLKAKVMKPFKESIKVEAAQLENNAGIIGARYLFHNDVVEGKP